MKKIDLTSVAKQSPIITAQQIIGVQPMTGPTGQVFKMKHEYAAIMEIDNAIVDGEQWYQIGITREIHNWLIKEYKQDKDKTWVYIGPSMYRHVHDVHEKIYIMLLLKWS